MKKKKFSTKLKLGKQVISPLNVQRSSQIIGGDAPTYGECTAQTCLADCMTNDTYLSDNDCPSHFPKNPCDDPTESVPGGLCFSEGDCTKGECTDNCPPTWGDPSCPEGPPC